MEEGTPKLPSAGDVVGGKYRVERVIGRGGMGTVLAVRHLGLDEPRALKLMLPRGMELPQARERFFREARAAAKLRSDNAVAIHDVGILPDGFPYIEMELLEGADLAQLLKRSGPIPVAQAVEWIAQACDPVGEAHALGIVHRDIKPGNLFLARTPSGRAIVKVLDFGIAKTANVETDPSLTGTNASFGSPMYMSPEQMRGARFADPRSDLWALGVVLFELLTGRRPFVSESITALALIVTSDPAPHPMSLRPEVPPVVDAVVMRCLEKSPDRRFASAAELGAALRRALLELGAAPTARTSLASSDGGLHAPPLRPPTFSGSPAAPPSTPWQPTPLASARSSLGDATGDPSRPSMGASPTSPSSPTVGTLSTTVGRRPGPKPAMIIGLLCGAVLMGLLVALVAWRGAGATKAQALSASGGTATLAPAPLLDASAAKPAHPESAHVASAEPEPQPSADVPSLALSASPASPTASAKASGPTPPPKLTSSAASGSRPSKQPAQPKTGFGGID